MKTESMNGPVTVLNKHTSGPTGRLSSGSLLLLGLMMSLSLSLQAQDADSDNTADVADAADVANLQDSDIPQAFNLFEGVDNGRADEENRRTPASRERNAVTEPEFTLIGTSRIGDRYSAILANRDGSEILVRAEKDSNAAVEGYSGFSVVNVSAGKVALQFPGGTPCVAFRDQGVSCNGSANIATLELTNLAPLAAPADTDPAVGEAPGTAENGEVIVNAENGDEPTNPFAAIRARALSNTNGDNPAGAAQRNAQRRSFTPRRIDPADVPDGMRVVSTPFGDRLVEDR